MKLSAISKIITIFTSLVLFFSCYSGDMAIVTIHIQGRTSTAAIQHIKEKSLIDRFLIFFSSPANAAWSYTPDYLTVTITAPDMTTIVENIEQIPAESMTLSFEVPSGTSRTITVQSGNNDTGINWGAQQALTLNAGQEVQLVMKMVPITNINVGSESSYNFITMDTVDSPNATGYHVYRSTNSAGPFSKVGSVDVNTGYEFTVYYDSQPPGGNYYYRVRVYGSDGEGMFSDVAGPSSFHIF